VLGEVFMTKFEHTILVIDYDMLSVTALTHLLSDEFNVVAERCGSESVKTAREVQPDVILLDVVLPDINGFEVIAMLKQDVLTKDIPVIFVTGLNNTRDEEQGLMLGAVDYINKPFSSYIVKLRIKNQLQIAKQIQTIRKLSTSDPLTGAKIRKDFLSDVDTKLQEAAATNSLLGLAIFSIDNFKHYNENNGHQKGDEVIKRLSQIISAAVPQGEDSVARWSGDELAMFSCMPGNCSAISLQSLVRLRRTATPVGKKAAEPLSCSEALEYVKTIVSDIFNTIKKDMLDITLSVGIHVLTPDSKYTIDNLILDTSVALAHAKRTGKGKVSTYEEAKGSM